MRAADLGVGETDQEEQAVPGLEKYRETDWRWYMYGRYARALPYVRDRRVVEIGAGIGWGASLLAPYASAYVAVDNSAHARERHVALFPDSGVDYRAGISFDLVAAGVTGDVIIAFELIEHLRPSQTAALFRDMRALLPGGGVILLTSEFPDDPIEAAHIAARNPFHPRVYTKAELTSLAQNAGLGRIRFESRLFATIRVKAWT